MKVYKFKYKKENYTGCILSVDWKENLAKVLSDEEDVFTVSVYSVAMCTSQCERFTFFDVLDDIKKAHPKR